MSKNNNLEYYPEEKILNPPLHARNEINLILKLLTKNKKKNIVDFGSGGGRLTIPLLQKGYKVIAIDIDEKSREQLLKTAIKIEKNKNIQIRKTFPKGEKYDYILGTDILHHVNIFKYFQLFNNHLKNGGKIIFSEPNVFNISWLIFISLFLDWQVEKGIFQINYFNLIKQLKRAGFKKVKIIGLFLSPPMILNWLPLLRKINMFLGNLLLLKLFSFRYIIVAQR
jgi:2-polyprenyl-3-methyl-5-hydroxy-6-metoxy-1,4-benzoquinol methylase